MEFQIHEKVSSYTLYLRGPHAPYMTYRTISLIPIGPKINLSICFTPIAL